MNLPSYYCDFTIVTTYNMAFIERSSVLKSTIGNRSIIGQSNIGAPLINTHLLLTDYCLSQCIYNKTDIV